MSNRIARDLDLRVLRLNAKIDYLSVYTDRKVPLPRLKGRPIWPRNKNGTLLTVQDATADDVEALTCALGNRRLHEIEVCVDFRCGRTVPIEQRRAAMLDVIVNLCAKGLYPRGGPLMEKAARAFYRRLENGYSVQPFNRRLPRGTDQLLYGWRGDWAQVKVYFKRRDQGRDLNEAKHVARVEVRLRGDGLHHNGLETLADLIGFKFRKKLSPYFRITRGAYLRGPGDKASSPMLRLFWEWQQRHLDSEWDKVGVGSLQTGGMTAHIPHRLLRDLEANDRIGQALHRLEKSFRTEKFVRAEPIADHTTQAPARACDRLRQSAMTIL